MKGREERRAGAQSVDQGRGRHRWGLGHRREEAEMGYRTAGCQGGLTVVQYVYVQNASP